LGGAFSYQSAAYHVLSLVKIASMCFVQGERYLIFRLTSQQETGLAGIAYRKNSASVPVLYCKHTLVGQQRLGMGILEGLGILVGLGILEGGERRLARGGLVGWLVIFTGLPSLQPDVNCQLYSMKKTRQNYSLSNWIH
jgi:hypothetical protein